MTTPKYTLRKEDDRFYLLDQNDYVKTPKGNRLSTTNESLATALLTALENGESFEDPVSVLAFHLFYLDEGDQEETLRKEFGILPLDCFASDPYLMLGQDDSSDSATVAQHYFETIPSYLAALPLHKLVAYAALWSASDSLLLPFHIITRDVRGEDLPDAGELVPIIEAFTQYFSFEEV